MSTGVYNPVVPFAEPLPFQLQSGQVIRIQGIPNSSATCFSINLQRGSSMDRRNDVALHLSPVFSPPPRLVRNSIQNQQWGPEESHGAHFPFAPGQSFEILILADTDNFKIAINGQHFTEFRYRLPLTSISHLSVDGDVMINAVKYDGKSAQSSPISETAKGMDVTMPIGFFVPDVSPTGPPPSGYGRPSSPYGVPTYNMPTGDPSQNPYGPPPMSAPYLPQQQPHGYPNPSHSPTYPVPAPHPSYPATSPTSGYPSQQYPSGGYPGENPYPSQHGGYPAQPGAYPSQPGGYPTQPGGYPSHAGAYPSQHGYPSQPGPYPGTSVVYPGSEKEKGGVGGMSSFMGPLAAGAAALAGSGLMGAKHGKHGKHGGGGPMSFITDGAASLLGGGGKHGSGHHSSKSSPIPIGGAVAGGAAALAGAYMLSKTPVGHFFK